MVNELVVIKATARQIRTRRRRLLQPFVVVVHDLAKQRRVVGLGIERTRQRGTVALVNGPSRARIAALVNTAGPPCRNKSKACRNETPSCCCTNWITLPAFPHAMQCHNPLAGDTMKFGLFLSSWNGHRPIKSFVPCLASSMPRLRTSASKSVCALHAVKVGFRNAPGHLALRVEG